MIYYIPTKIYFENKSLNYLKEIVKNYNPRNIFLISGKNFIKNSGILDKILNDLKEYKVLVYNKINPVPKLEEIESTLNEARNNNTDLIIGIGGGSVLDTSKIASAMLNNEGNILDYINNKKIKSKGVNLISIPTTAGTGSEVTPFAAFYCNNKKQSFGNIEDYLIYPDYAIVDPELTITMPKDITASTGLDALSQSIESYWSINSNPLSDTHAIESIRLALDNLENAYNHPKDINFRYNMSKASLEAGLAFSQTATTAPHSISYPMTAYSNLNHGFACALTLPEFLLYNYDVNKKNCLDKRGYKFVKKRLDELIINLNLSSIEDFYFRLKNLMKNINAPLTLKEAGIDNIETILENGFTPERMKNNPRKVKINELRRILEKIR